MSRDQRRIAVAMATFNGARFLGEQLRSILNQTRLPDEIVISDDHSSDGTLSVAKSFRAEAKKKGVELRVLTHQGAAGVARNFHYAASKTSAELIALADQDDIWLPDKLAALEGEFSQHPNLLMVHSDAWLVDEEGGSLNLGVLDSLRITSSEKNNLIRGKGIRAVVRRNLVTGSTAMIRRDLVTLAGVVPEGWLHDEWWALVAASHDGLLLTPAVYQLYRQHASNQVGATQSGWQRLMERFSEPQSRFRDRHRLRHEGLQRFIARPEWSGTSEANELLQGRLRHYQDQAALASPRLARVIPIGRALISGDYARYRRGAFDALRDFLQPAG